ncbi:MAG: LysR family transcriptional regulator [Eisenbergiella sp.]
MNINKYRLLIKAIELGNLTKAAQELGYTQSGASHQIKSVEEELGIKILQRDRSGTKLTTEGNASALYPARPFHVRIKSWLLPTPLLECRLVPLKSALLQAYPLCFSPLS